MRRPGSQPNRTRDPSVQRSGLEEGSGRIWMLPTCTVPQLLRGRSGAECQLASQSGDPEVEDDPRANHLLTLTDVGVDRVSLADTSRDPSHGPEGLWMAEPRVLLGGAAKIGFACGTRVGSQSARGADTQLARCIPWRARDRN